MRRKGELSKSSIDRGWPHQIALPADQVSGRRYDGIRQFCSVLSIRPRGHSFVRGDQWHAVFCFAEREDGELFQRRYGGEWFDRKAERARQRERSRISRIR